MYAFTMRPAAVVCLALLTAAAVQVGASGADGPATAPATGPAAGPGRSFKMGVALRSVVETEGMKKQDLVGDMEVAYTWRLPAPGERVLSFDSFGIKLTSGGAAVMDMSMSRTKFARTQGGRTTEVSADTGPERVRAMLRDTFGPPLCRVEVDAEGREVRRTMVAAKETIATLGDDGMIVNVLALHPQPPAGRDQWDADAELRSGTGGGFKGKLTYKKAAGGTKDGRQAYAVSGTLTQPAPAAKGGEAPKAGEPAKAAVAGKASTCVVTGEQTFDPARKEWVAGRLNVDMMIHAVVGERAPSTVKGTMVLTVEEVAGGT